jgi:hypothetical protein
MLVGHQDGVYVCGLKTDVGEAALDLPAGEACVEQEPR